MIILIVGALTSLQCFDNLGLMKLSNNNNVTTKEVLTLQITT